jgi:hypothetical protein
MAQLSGSFTLLSVLHGQILSSPICIIMEMAHSFSYIHQISCQLISIALLCGPLFLALMRQGPTSCALWFNIKDQCLTSFHLIIKDQCLAPNDRPALWFSLQHLSVWPCNCIDTITQWLKFALCYCANIPLRSQTHYSANISLGFAMMPLPWLSSI